MRERERERVRERELCSTISTATVSVHEGEYDEEPLRHTVKKGLIL